MADDTIFDRARGIRAAIRAQNEKRKDEQAIQLQGQALGRFERVLVAFESAVEALDDAKEIGLEVAAEASLPPKVEVGDPADFFSGNALPGLEDTLKAAVEHLDGTVDIAFRDAVIELDGHPAGEHELAVLADLDLEVADAAMKALADASGRWLKEVQNPRRPDLEEAKRLAKELDDAWGALEESGVSKDQVNLLRRLAGDCVPLTTVDLEDIAWLFEVGFASTLKLCSNSSRGR